MLFRNLLCSIVPKTRIFLSLYTLLAKSTKPDPGVNFGTVSMFSLSNNPDPVFGQHLNTLSPRNSDDSFKDAQKYLCIKKTFPEIFGFHLRGCISCSFFLAPLHKTTYFVQIESALAELLSVVIQTQSGYLILC